MPKPIPFLFCRYELYVGDEVLDARGQFEALSELQGKYYPHGKKAEEEGLYDSVVMRPRSFQLDGETVLTWSVGQLIGGRVAARYDQQADELKLQYQQDDSIRYADFVAVPSVGAMAVDDRSGETRLGGRTAANRFRSVFRHLPDGDASILLATDYSDLQKALDRWRLTSFMFTVRPPNPHAPSEIAKRTGELLKERNVARETGKWEAYPGEGIKPDNNMKGIVDLAEAGYGQVAVRDLTPDGHTAQIKKAPFYYDVEKNIASQEKPREMRVYIETEYEGEDSIFIATAKALLSFYA